MMIDIYEYKMIVNRIRSLPKYIKELENLQDEILSASPMPPDGQPRGNKVGNSVEDKVLKLNSNKRISFLQQMIVDIETTYAKLDTEMQNVWKLAIVKNHSIVALERELAMSRNTIYRKKRAIIESLATIWGIK